MGFQFVVLLDVQGDTLKEAYSSLLDFMAKSSRDQELLIGWETSDEVYDLEGDGTSVDIEDVRRECLAELDRRKGSIFVSQAEKV